MRRGAPDQAWLRTTRARLRGRLVAAGLHRIAGEVAGLSLPAVRLRPADGSGGAGSGGAGPVGATRLAGRADLPPGQEWPRDPEGRPLPFLAQLDLAELAPYDRTHELPAAGTLSFFYDLLDRPWGYDPRHAGRWVVRYTAPGVPLAPREAPAGPPREAFFPAQRLTPSAELAPPDARTHEALGADPDERDRLARLLHDDGAPVHRVLGQPLCAQGPMELQCQLVSNGVSVGDGRYERHPRFEALRPGAADWRLLLQLDSGDALRWGDIGRLYFWIRRQDLRDRAWDRVWLVLQTS